MRPQLEVSGGRRRPEASQVGQQGQQTTGEARQYQRISKFVPKLADHRSNPNPPEFCPAPTDGQRRRADGFEQRQRRDLARAQIFDHVGETLVADHLWQSNESSEEWKT